MCQGTARPASDEYREVRKNCPARRSGGAEMIMSHLIVDVKADRTSWEVRKRGSGTANARPGRYDDGGSSATGSRSCSGVGLAMSGAANGAVVKPVRLGRSRRKRGR